MNAKISTDTLANIITEIIAEPNKTASAVEEFIDVSLNTDKLNVLQINFELPESI
tara:strand:- start:945 stop:1109 length:165 start_codon:yes stop_codon:yes gene_type:complete